MTKIFVRLLLISSLLLGLGCTSPNPAYCERDEDCKDTQFPSCDLSIHGCVGAVSVDGGSDSADAGDDGDVLVGDGDDSTDSGDPNQSGDDGGITDDGNYGGDLTDGSDGLDGRDGPDRPDGSDGSASDESMQQYVFVDINTCPETGTGTEGDPFCSIQDAVDAALGTSLPVLILAGHYTEDIHVNGDVDIETSGEGVVLETSSCPGVLVMNRANVSISNLEITGTGGVRVTAESNAVIKDSVIRDTSCIGMDCQGSTCQVTRCEISNNSAGGMSLTDSTYTVTNNMIVQNGESGVLGGVEIRQPGSSSRFVFNTVADNHTSGMAISGITCYTPSLIESSIVWGNDDAGMGQVSEICTANYCDIDQDIAFVNGSNNISEDPQFIENENDDYHISPDSPCVDAADTHNPPDDDIDGQTRPIGMGPDIGADEAH